MASWKNNFLCTLGLWFDYVGYAKHRWPKLIGNCSSSFVFCWFCCCWCFFFVYLNLLVNKHTVYFFIVYSVLYAWFRSRLKWSFGQGFWYLAGKKAKFRGIFRGKFAEKSVDFTGFSREKRQNSQKNWPISRDFSEKKSNFEGFQGQILRKMGRFHDFHLNITGPRLREISEALFGLLWQLENL